ncbi:MAG: hypothetical protein H6867_06070 [Rhodospirillales bacterium]|nr:hypothetical protein [Rhodospirillales bacterium]MCB9995095.1 hypothetical protein [Rhodospirillales bacterium]
MKQSTKKGWLAAGFAAVALSGVIVAGGIAEMILNDKTRNELCEKDHICNEKVDELRSVARISGGITGIFFASILNAYGRKKDKLLKQESESAKANHPDNPSV